MNHAIFLNELSRLQKLYFLLKEYMDGVCRNIFCRLFSRSFFFGQGENTPRKYSVETQSMKIQVNSGEMQICKNVGKIMQNVGRPQTYTYIGKVNILANTQNSIIINKGKDLKISKKQV